MMRTDSAMEMELLTSRKPAAEHLDG